MTAAAGLVQAGVPVVLVEATPTVQTDWRASTFHPPTLELLDGIGIADRMLAEGLRVPVYHFRDRGRWFGGERGSDGADGLVASFDFGLLADETPFPFRLQLNQQHLVRMLAERLDGERLATVRFGTKAVELRQDSGGVTLVVESDRRREELRGSHLIGADGARSTVRGLLGIPFEGFTYPERFLIVSTSADLGALLPGIADVNYVADPDQWLFLLHTPESWRAVYPLPASVSEAEAKDPDRIQAHLQAIAPKPDGYEITDHQLYSVHQRVAATFRAGNVVLVGDAAHVNSPLGGVGLNSGIHDAVDVTRRIARIREDSRDADRELDLFATLRRQVALEYVQADTNRNTQRVSERDPDRRRANYDELRAIAADPDRARAWCRRASLLESVQRFGIGARPAPPASPALPEESSTVEPELEALYADLAANDLYPLWTITDELLTAAPEPRAVPWLWPAKTLRALADRALELIPVERGGERRVLSLGNPGLGGTPYAAGTLWGAVQCLRPGELAPAHRHSPGAIRFVLEGHGVWTTVNGDACDMNAGDLILTPSWNWHEHTGADASGMLWFDGLDLPMVQALDAIFFEPYPELRQPAPAEHNASLARYGDRNRYASPAVTDALDPSHSPLLVYPWADTDAELTRKLTDSTDPMVSLEFINPVTGASVLPTLACSMHRLRAGGMTGPTRRTGNTILVVYSGSGHSVVGGVRFDWAAGDILVVPSWVPLEHHANEQADLFALSDTPVLRALGLYREQELDAPQPVRGAFTGREQS